MKTVEILSLPKIIFAHKFEIQSYSNRFKKQSGFLEISYIADGSLTLVINNKKYTANKGDVMCHLRDSELEVYANKPHCHHTVGIAVNWQFLNGTESGLLLPVITPSKNNTSQIQKVIDSIIANEIKYKIFVAAGAKKALELVCEVDRCNKKASTNTLPSETLYVERSKKYIQKNITAPITQQQIATHLGISPEYLCSVFKKGEGITVMRYINQLKLQNIKALVEHKNMHLYQESAVYGYNDPNYVSRLFKKIYGHNITDKLTIKEESRISDEFNEKK